MARNATIRERTPREIANSVERLEKTYFDKVELPMQAYMVGYRAGLSSALDIVKSGFSKPNGHWTSAKAKACYDELRAMMEHDRCTDADASTSSAPVPARSGTSGGRKAS